MTSLSDCHSEWIFNSSDWLSLRLSRSWNIYLSVQPPVAKPRTDNGLDKKATPTKRRTSKSPGRDLEEILDSGRKSQIFANSKHGANEMQRGKPKTVTSESDSVQVRLSLLSTGTFMTVAMIVFRRCSKAFAKPIGPQLPMTTRRRLEGCPAWWHILFAYSRAIPVPYLKYDSGMANMVISNENRKLNFYLSIL